MPAIDHSPLSIGFMPLLDCAPLVVAKRCGFFAEQGLDVRLQRQNSWATLRDKLHAGMLDAAQMLAPMPIASSLGLGCAPTSIKTPFVMSYHGNGITISKHLAQILDLHIEDNQPALPNLSTEQLALWERHLGRPVRLATVFPYSNHYYQLLDWLPNNEQQRVNIIIIPPAHLVAMLEAGDIDGFCVGGPWNAVAVRLGLGTTVCTSTDLWPDMPEKVLGVSADWCDENAETLNALTHALQKACDWLSPVPNRFEAARWLSDAHIIDQPIDAIAPGLLGSCLVCENATPRYIADYYRFSSPGIGNRPNEDALYTIFTKMRAAGHIGEDKSVRQSELVSSLLKHR